jgi:hypothetical protein
MEGFIAHLACLNSAYIYCLPFFWSVALILGVFDSVISIVMDGIMRRIRLSAIIVLVRGLSFTSVAESSICIINISHSVAFRSSVPLLECECSASDAICPSLLQYWYLAMSDLFLFPSFSFFPVPIIDCWPIILVSIP